MTKIILQRHGQSFGNLNKIFLGHTDLGLTEEGLTQAQITADHLINEDISAIYSSDLLRAKQTASAHASRRGMPVFNSKLLRELYVGDWEGKRIEELKKNFYEDFCIRRSYRDFEFPNGEGNRDGARRLSFELKRISQKHQGESVLVISHAAVIRSFCFFEFCGIGTDMSKSFPLCLNSSYSVLTFDGYRFSLLKYGVSDFLPDTDVHPW